MQDTAISPREDPGVTLDSEELHSPTEDDELDDPGFSVAPTDSVLGLANGCPPLHAAVLKNGAAEAARLCSAGADINAVENEEWTPLSIAAWNGNPELVHTLLGLGADAGFIPKSLPSMLHMSIFHGFDAITAMLVEHDAKIDLVWKEIYHPLYLAALKGRFKAAELLFQRSSNPNFETPLGKSPLDRFADSGSTKFISLCLDANVSPCGSDRSDLKPLHYVAIKGHLDALDMLISRGAVVDCQTRAGFTPLHFAARIGHEEAVALLLKRGAKADSRSRDRSTPMHLAAQSGHARIVKLLRVDRALFSSVSADGLRPIDLAAKNGHYKIVQDLMSWAQCG